MNDTDRDRIWFETVDHVRAKYEALGYEVHQNDAARTVTVIDRSDNTCATFADITFEKFRRVQASCG